MSAEPERTMTVGQVNQQMINLMAKLQLELAGQRPDPTLPHLLQLARWGADAFLEGEGEELRCQLNELLDRLVSADPETVVKMFYPDREESNDMAEELRRRSPTEAARFVLEDLVREAIDMTYIRFIPSHSYLNQAACSESLSFTGN
jgi:hypothetical protein